VIAPEESALRPVFRFPVLLLAVAIVATLACNSNDPDEPPTAEETVQFCRDVERTSAALEEVRDSIVPLDEVALQESRADLRASLDYLESSSRELEGGYDLVVDLEEDLNELLELTATTNLVSARTNVEAQIARVQEDINYLEAAGNCP
jgi:hypothetical protein